MDKMVVRPGLPGEDEFALMALGAASPYCAILFPSAISEIPQLSSPSFWDSLQAERWSKVFLNFSAACQAQAPSLPLLLKSPPHSFRIALLKSLCPNIRFIMITRDREAVFASTRKMWASLWQLYALDRPPKAAAIDNAIVNTMAALDSALCTAADEVDRICPVSYEMLVEEPRLVISSVLDFLRIPVRDPDVLAQRIVETHRYSSAKSGSPAPLQSRPGLRSLSPP